MKVNGSDLARALKIVRPAVSRKISFKPEFAWLRLKSDGELLTVSAMCFDMAIEVDVPCSGEIDAYFEHRMLQEMVTPGELRIDVGPEGGAVFEYPWMIAEIATETAEKHCEIESFEHEKLVRLSKNEMEKIFFLMPFACKDDARQVLQSVYVDQGRYAATDTHRLAVIESNCDKEIGRVLPLPLLKAIKAALPRFYDGVSIGWSSPEKNAISVAIPDAGVRISYNDTTGVMKFPDYFKVIPDDGSVVFRVHVNVAEMRHALIGIEPIAYRNTNRVSIGLKEDAIEISAKCHLMAASAKVCAGVARMQDLEPLIEDQERFEPKYRASYDAIDLNARYLLDGLKFMEHDTAQIDLTSSKGPICMRGCGRMYLAMPMEME